MKFFISYDLEDGKTKEYRDIKEYLEDLGGRQLFRSQWLINSPEIKGKEAEAFAEDLANYFVGLFKKRVMVLVIALDGGGICFTYPYRI